MKTTRCSYENIVNLTTKTVILKIEGTSSSGKDDKFVCLERSGTQVSIKKPDPKHQARDETLCHRYSIPIHRPTVLEMPELLGLPDDRKDPILVTEEIAWLMEAMNYSYGGDVFYADTSPESLVSKEDPDVALHEMVYGNCIATKKLLTIRSSI